MSNKRKSICFVATVEFVVSAFLVNHLKKLSADYDLTVITKTNNIDFLSEQGVLATVIQIKISRNINLMSDANSLALLIKQFKNKQFDAIHSLTPKAGLLAMLAGFICGVPIRIHTFTGQVWATSSGVKRLLLKSIDTFYGGLATHVIVDSPSQYDFLLAENVISKNKSFVFNKGSISGVDVSKFKPNLMVRERLRGEIDISSDGVLLLFLGRLNYEKGVLDLAKAFINAELEKAQLIFVGPDEKEMEVIISNLSGFDDNKIKFFSYTKTPESYMAASDILCLPSYREGFGTVVIEAAACGVPAIASRIYGITDAVVDNETGLLHEPGNVDDIKIKMELLVNDATMRKKLSEQSRVRVTSDFSSQLITQAWVDFYHQRFEE